MTAAATAVLTVLIMARILVGASLTAATSADWPLNAGHFYTQAAESGAGAGFAVVDDTAAPLFTEARRLGGPAVLGYPVSRRYRCDGYVCQAFQRVILQWHPETGTSAVVNLYEELSAGGWDDWLSEEWSIPRPRAANEEGLDWPTVAARRMTLLENGDPAGDAIRRFYYGTGPDWLSFNGLPMASIVEYERVRVLRSQKVVIQQWLQDTPRARAGEVTLADGGLIARAAGLIPREALQPEPGSRYPAGH